MKLLEYMRKQPRAYSQTIAETGAKMVSVVQTALRETLERMEIERDPATFIQSSGSALLFGAVMLAKGTGCTRDDFTTLAGMMFDKANITTRQVANDGDAYATVHVPAKAGDERVN